MTHKQLRFAIFGNEYQARKSAGVKTLLDYLLNRHAEVYIDRSYADFLMKRESLPLDGCQVFDGDDFVADYVVSMGGDGTFLKAASRVGEKQIPIFGVNMGRLGFLADVLPSEIEQMLDAVYEGDYKTESRSVIQIETEGETVLGSPYALNDIAVLKRDNASMISIQTTIDNDYLVTYQADGLVVSTPTGSTAYSLSNGGPILVPQSGNICLTPVAPHSLNIRPIVINDQSVITLRVVSRSHNFLVAIDGRSQKLRETTTVTIRKAPFETQIIKRPRHRYFSTLREKMMWGLDQRD